MTNSYSIIIPAYNEAGAVGGVLEELVRGEPREQFEIIVVDDCSTDATRAVAEKFPVTVLSNVQNFGYGYSLKRGIRAARFEHVIIIDADGSYPVSELSKLVAVYERGYDMVVGARQGVHYQGSFLKRVARFFFRIISEFATGRHIPDINSGCRIFRKDLATSFFHTLSSGFSFTTTITLAFMLNAHSVGYVPIEYHKRHGSSKVRYLRDTLRSAQIIIEAIVFYNPIKIFMLCALGIVASGIVGALVSLISPFFGMLLFLALAFTILIVSIGFIAVFLKFTHAQKAPR
jgi:glycosyltransferase involved in cell wall biosynthesis